MPIRSSFSTRMMAQASDIAASPTQLPTRRLHGFWHLNHRVSPLLMLRGTPGVADVSALFVRITPRAPA